MQWVKEKELALALYILEESEKGQTNPCYLMAMEALVRGDISKASEQALIAALSSKRRPWMVLGTVFSLQKLHQAAIGCYKIASKINPKDPYPHYYPVSDYVALGDLTSASSSLRLALGLAKQDVEFETLEKDILLLMGKHSES